MTLQHDILRGLVLQYQKTKDPLVFKKILLRVEGLIISVIVAFKKRTPYLDGIDLEVLYQIAIIGVHDAAITSPADEVPERFPNRVAAYIKSKIRQEFEYRGKPEENTREVRYDDIIYEDIVSADILEMVDGLRQMYVEGEITYEDIELLRGQTMEQQPLRILGPSHNKSHEWARLRLFAVIDRIREYFKEKDDVN